MTRTTVTDTITLGRYTARHAHRVRLELDPAIEHFTAALDATVAGVDWAALAERAHAVHAEALRAAGTLSDVQPWVELSQAYRDAWIAAVRAVYAEAVGAAVGAAIRAKGGA